MSIPTPDRDDVTEALEDGPSRYAAYAMRLRTLITSTSRYVAYTSDIGEAFRPLTSPTFVRACYGISWAYLLGDVGYAGYKAHQQHEHDTAGVVSQAGDKAKEAVQVATDKLKQAAASSDHKTELRRSHDGSLETHAVGHSAFSHVGLVMARRAVFQSIASMALPAFTIHSVVRYSAPLFARSSSKRVRGAGPTIAGLAFVPALPFFFDHPVGEPKADMGRAFVITTDASKLRCVNAEVAVDRVFDVIEEQLVPSTSRTKDTPTTDAAKEAVEQLKAKVQNTKQKLE